ncbi:uncharacterized protein SCDLUD_000395 [Saccharomycodes ludwigii]|uniref:uncharacterized protein n=1 Tax=Saccharomycodes ludwigii TaxID=36035 RepID=UPI001E882006|nr:hypothetical protein SCDLUD_000395 [Saccharomycodes ludwigii]KAH3902804.1 hypothetical protein SCDLUD_000395 [Saccharomycodes ludwigii]
MTSINNSVSSFYAFYSLYKHFYPEKPEVTFKQINDTASLYNLDNSFKPTSKTSLFITWNIKAIAPINHHTSSDSDSDSSADEEGYKLRGCIGTFAKLPLSSGVKKYSLISALHDSRFPPIKSNELVNLKVTCNILHTFKTIYDKKNSSGDIFDWEIGKHGIELVFEYNGIQCSATFLPDVMVEQHWDKEQTFKYLILKGSNETNLMSIIYKNWKKYFVQVIRYEGTKSTCGYDEFLCTYEKIVTENKDAKNDSNKKIAM